MAGYTPYGVPIYPEDAYGWDCGMGFPDSPTNIAERAAAVADLRCMEAVRMLERRLDMSGIQDMKRDTSVGDFKLGFNRMKARLAGNPLPTVLTCFIALASFAGSVDVQKANLNDLGNDLVVTNVVLSGEFGHSATDLTEKVEFFNDIRDGKETGVKEAFSNAVAAVSSGGTSPVVQDFDARKLEHVDGFFDDLRTNRNAAATLSMSNAVVRFSPPQSPQDFDATKLVNQDRLFDDLRTNRNAAATLSMSNAVVRFSPAGVPQDFDARKLENVDGFFDDLRTNKSPVARTSFSNAVDSVVSKTSSAPVHSSVPGAFSPVAVGSDSSAFVRISESPSGMQKAESARTLRVGDLTDIWIGGTETNGTVIGGQTAYGTVMSLAEGVSRGVVTSTVDKAISDSVYVTNSATSGSYIGTVKSAGKSYPLYAPYGTSVTRSLLSGTAIATITVGTDSQTLYAPSTPEYLGTRDLHIDSSLDLYSSDQWNTEAWDVYAEYSDKYLAGTPAPTVMHTNFVFDVSKTNMNTKLNPSYQWRREGTNGMTYVDVPWHPMKFYDSQYTRMNLRSDGKEMNLYHYSKYYVSSSYNSVYIASSYDVTGDVVKNDNVSTVIVGTENGTNVLQLVRWFAVRRQPYFLNEGRVASSKSVEDAVGAAFESLGGKSAIAGYGSESNTMIRYDGYATRSYTSVFTNSTSFRSPYYHYESGTDQQTGKTVNPDDVYLYPETVNSWTGSVYVSNSKSSQGGTVFPTSRVVLTGDGRYTMKCEKTGYVTFSSDGDDTEFAADGRMIVKVRGKNGSLSLLHYVTLRDGGESPVKVSGDVAVVEEDSVAFSNRLASVAYTGYLRATNTTDGTTVEIEPYTTDGTTILWRVK